MVVATVSLVSQMQDSRGALYFLSRLFLHGDIQSLRYCFAAECNFHWQIAIRSIRWNGHVELIDADQSWNKPAYEIWPGNCPILKSSNVDMLVSPWATWPATGVVVGVTGPKPIP